MSVALQSDARASTGTGALLQTSKRAAKTGAISMAIGAMLMIVEMPAAEQHPGLQAGMARSYGEIGCANRTPNGNTRVEQTMRRQQHEITGGRAAADASPTNGAAEKIICLAHPVKS